MSSSTHIHIHEEDELFLEVKGYNSPLEGSYMRLSSGGTELVLHVPPSRAHEVSYFLKKAAIYFEGCTCEPGSPDDQCVEHGYEEWLSECCGAPPHGSTPYVDADHPAGICCKCRDNTGFEILT